ncbi:MAG: hypothetical protein RLZZ468_1927 [Cyanobacteriota bacterium]
MLRLRPPLTLLLLLVLAAAPGLPRLAQAGAIGLAAARPYSDAVTSTRQAATAVLARSGKESCLRGKLTRALLGLTASCEAGGLHTPLCGLAERAVVVPVWSLPFMDATARELLAQLQESPSAPGSP